ncbi:MAG: hypothetical protein ACE5WD_08435 [Candidatus Aminicenantia bacterium]
MDESFQRKEKVHSNSLLITKTEEYNEYRRTLLGQFKNYILFISFLIGIYYIFLKNERDWLMGISLSILPPLLVNFPFFAYKNISWIHRKYNINLLKFYEGIALLILILSSTGSIYLFYIPIEFDWFVHFIETFSASLMIVIFITIYKENKNGIYMGAKKAGWLIFWYSIAIAILWEIYQFTGDTILGTKMFYDYNQTVIMDAITDIISGILGGTIGAFLVYKYYWDKILTYFKR